MEFCNLSQLFQDQIRDLYSAESQLVEALPMAVKKAHNPELKRAVQNHLEETRGHLRRLQTIGEGLGFKPGGKKCKAMAGLIEETREALGAEGDQNVIDEAIIAAAQRVEHYEISAYGTARAIADQLGLGEAAELLQETLDEEGAADKRLTDISEGGVLQAAAATENGGALDSAD